MALAAVGATNIGSIEVEWLLPDYTYSLRWNAVHTSKKYCEKGSCIHQHIH